MRDRALVLIDRVDHGLVMGHTTSGREKPVYREWLTTKVKGKVMRAMHEVDAKLVARAKNQAAFRANAMLSFLNHFCDEIAKKLRKKIEWKLSDDFKLFWKVKNG